MYPRRTLYLSVWDETGADRKRRVRAINFSESAFIGTTESESESESGEKSVPVSSQTDKYKVR